MKRTLLTVGGAGIGAAMLYLADRHTWSAASRVAAAAAGVALMVAGWPNRSVQHTVAGAIGLALVERALVPGRT